MKEGKSKKGGKDKEVNAQGGRYSIKIWEESDDYNKLSVKTQ